jgi:hypothetical protein
MCFRIPYVCKFKPGIPGIHPMEEEEEEEGSRVTEEKEEEREAEEMPELWVGEDMYGLSVELRQEGRQAVQLLNTRTDSARVRYAIPYSLFLVSI